MYLSKLLLTPPPACRQVIQDLADPYQLHRTILRAFPTRADGGPGRVLFRDELCEPGRPVPVLVQSDKAPDWSALAELPGYLVAEPECKPLELPLSPGQRLRFRLRANPTVKRDGKRQGLVHDEHQRTWLERKAQAAGCRVLAVRTRHAHKHVCQPTGKHPHRQTHLAVLFDGVLEIVDPKSFTKAVAAGIGPAKAYGFGLLSVAPV